VEVFYIHAAKVPKVFTFKLVLDDTPVLAERMKQATFSVYADSSVKKGD
jgi:hypothetical protein